jgi:hypothetical protein
MPAAPLANLQLGRAAWSSQRMPAIVPLANALEARREERLLAGRRWSRTAASWMRKAKDRCLA